MKRNELSAFLSLWAFATLGGLGVGWGLTSDRVAPTVAGVVLILFALVLALGGYYTHEDAKR